MARRTSRRLAPNAAIDRLTHIRKVYEDKQPWVVLDTLSVIFDTIGIDNPEVEFTRETLDISRRDRIRARGMCDPRGKLTEGLFSLPQVRTSFYASDDEIPGYAEANRVLWMESPPSPTGTSGTPMIEFLKSMLGVVEMPAFADGAMREPHEADGIFPWAARELSKLAKEALRTGGDGYHSYRAYLFSLRDRANAIAQWAKAKRIDLMKMSLGEVLEASQDFRYSGKVRQGKVVYKFSSGWTVQELRGRRELDTEGDVQAHCVGTYCKKVESGWSVIYSLRDPDGVPYVTMEWQPHSSEVRAVTRNEGSFVQIFGFRNSSIANPPDPAFVDDVIAKGQENDPPLRDQAEAMEVIELIRAMVVEFIDKVKDGNLHGLALAGADLSGRDLTRAQLYNAGLANTQLRGVDLSGADLSHADLSGANLTDANLSGANLGFASLRGANLTDANMTDANLRNALYDSDTVWPEGFDFSDAAKVW